MTARIAIRSALGLPDTKVGNVHSGAVRDATKQCWIVISMKSDWKRIFAFDGGS
jgi:hypothetical protein